MNIRPESSLNSIESLINNPKTFFEGVEALDSFVSDPKNFKRLSNDKSLREEIRRLNTEIILQISNFLTNVANREYAQLDIDNEDGIDRISKLCTSVTNLIAESIYAANTLEKQNFVYERWINIADYLYKNGDYLNSQTITAKLHNALLTRLHPKGTLSPHAGDKLMFLLNQLGNNNNIFKNTEKERENLPKIPSASAILFKKVMFEEQEKRDKAVNAKESMESLYVSHFRARQIVEPNSFLYGQIYGANNQHHEIANLENRKNDLYTLHEKLDQEYRKKDADLDKLIEEIPESVREDYIKKYRLLELSRAIQALNSGPSIESIEKNQKIIDEILKELPNMPNQGEKIVNHVNAMLDTVYKHIKVINEKNEVEKKWDEHEKRVDEKGRQYQSQFGRSNSQQKPKKQKKSKIVKKIPELMEPNPVQINEALQKKENTQIIAVEKITSELKQTQNADAQIERKPEILEKTTSKAQQDQNVAVQAEKKPEPIPVQAAAPIPASPVIPPRINKENESVKAREFIRFSNEIIEVINKCNTLQGRPFISDVESKALVKINKELTGLYVKAVQCENKPLTPQLKSNIESIKENLQAYQQQLTMIDRGHAYYADNKKRFELIINHMKDKCGNLLKSKNMNEELKRALEDVIFKLTALQLEKDSSYDTVGTFVQNNAGTIKSISNEIKRIEVECEKINPKESQTMTMRNK